MSAVDSGKPVKPIEDCTDRELLVECVTVLRMVVTVFEQMSSSPMARMIPGMSMPKVR